MINLIRFFIHNLNVFLFLFFEFIALYLVVNYNQTQRNIFINSSSSISAGLLERSDRFRDYFNLSNINDRINQENAYLLSKIEMLKKNSIASGNGFHSFFDGKIISNQIDSRHNRFLINRGKNDGIRKGMGVLSTEYPIGIIYQVTENCASAISLLNVNLNLSTQIKNKDYFGSMTWHPPDIHKSYIYHIPAYAEILAGDTVITSGYSHTFPSGLPVGTVSVVKIPRGGNNLIVEVDLFVDMGTLKYVQISQNNKALELDSLTNDFIK